MSRFLSSLKEFDDNDVQVEYFQQVDYGNNIIKHQLPRNFV